MHASRVLILALLMTSAALLVAEEDTDLDVDRTDFSDPALEADKDVEEGPSQHVVAASLLPDWSNERIEIGVNNTLLVSLSNLGGKMYNVTFIDGHIERVASAERLGKFRRQVYGESLGPREQRSFRYLFVPPSTLKEGEYRFVFAAHYQNRDMAKFVDVVFNETVELGPASSSGFSSDEMLLGSGVAAGGLILLGIVYILGAGGSSARDTLAAKKEKPAAAKKATANSEDYSEWLQGTLAGSEGRSTRKKRRS